ncbi:NADH:flavin oxidoreductase/NADH oxidase family protein [Ramlibacter tataouinensis]|uniref:NADH:flavin oxidoreductase/NADH oxidase family protein n=1 Tax=Ramlibacter tataouinensis TaxID=94132 RepID=UPI0022F3E0B8|nr:NADH:flavin oxidoreductase/NADH oxidase family protein [Ramlibacter tataouinensis]WBY02846.1 NADH:flavin oxidoreductase/NADH oxidase family protein [Ramlibacter tataouinensis]
MRDLEKNRAPSLHRVDSPVGLNDPLALPCGQVLRNRLAKAAMSEQLAGRQSEPSPGLVELYRRWGGGGAALLLTGNVMVDRNAISEPGQVVVEDDRHLDRLSQWARAAKAQGAQVWMQINHAGRQVPISVSRRAVAPSAVPLPGPLFARPRALQGEEILALVQRFATTAKVAVQAGFDGVQIHAAHGYLISQFLSPQANRRQDDYGGDLQRRQRFLLEVIQAVRAAVGPHIPISVKLNASDFSRSGLTPDEALHHVSALERTSVDLLEISGGNFHTAAMLGMAAPETGAFARGSEGYFLDFARRARLVYSKPLMVTGGFRTGAAVDAALASGVIDLAGMARPMVMDAGIANRLLSGAAGDAAKAVLASGPRRAKARGLVGGLAEIAWYTVQMWRLSRGKPVDSTLGPWLASLRYLIRQNAQRALRS